MRFLRGVPISGSAVGNTFTDPAKRDAEVASGQKVDSIVRADRRAAHSHLRRCCSERHTDGRGEESFASRRPRNAAITPARKAFFLGLENHGGIVAEPRDLLDMVRAVKSRGSA
jgi:hypothetical protein